MRLHIVLDLPPKWLPCLLALVKMSWISELPLKVFTRPFAPSELWCHSCIWLNVSFWRELQHPGKTLAEQSRIPTNATDNEAWSPELNPVHLGGRVLRLRVASEEKTWGEMCASCETWRTRNGREAPLIEEWTPGLAHCWSYSFFAMVLRWTDLTFNMWLEFVESQPPECCLWILDEMITIVSFHSATSLC